MARKGHDELYERLVWTLYLGLLGRVPEPAGLHCWLKEFRAGRTFDEIFECFVASPEFKQRTRCLFDDFWSPEFATVLQQSGDGASRLERNLTFSHEQLARGEIDNRNQRIAVVSPYPPARTGVATATLNTFGAWQRGVDYFGEFETLEYLEAAAAELESLGRDHRVFSHGVLPEAIDATAYRAIVFVLGNSHHNVHVLYWLLKMREIDKMTPVVAYVHDPVVLDVLRRAAGPAGYTAAGLFERAYGPADLDFFKRRDYGSLVARGVSGMRAIRLATRIDHIVVNSGAAKDILLRDDPELDPAMVHQLFHPVFSAAAPMPSGSRATVPSSIHVGCFGIASQHKRIDAVLEVGSRLAARGFKGQLTVAGYNVSDAVDLARVWEWDTIEVYDNPDDRRLTELMAGVDVAVQLRAENTGETSGIVSMLLGLGTPTIVSSIGAFLEFGEAVRFVSHKASPDEVAASIVAILRETDSLRRKAGDYSATRSPQKFCGELDFILVRGDAPSSASTAPSPARSPISAESGTIASVPEIWPCSRGPVQHKLIHVFGYYNRNNAGDDAFGLFFHEVFGDAVRMREDRPHCLETHERIILGGGAVVRSYFLDRLPKFAQLDIAGASMEDRINGVDHLVALRERLGIVALRSAADVASARRQGVAAEAFPDLVFGIQPPSPSLSIADVRAMAPLTTLAGVADRTAIIFLSDNYSVRSDQEPERKIEIEAFKNQIAAALDELSNGYNLVLVPMSVSHGWRDACFAHDVVARMRAPEKTTLIETYLGPVQIMNLVMSVADVVISMKYHGLVFGMLCGKPVVNIADSNKNVDLMAEF